MTFRERLDKARLTAEEKWRPLPAPYPAAVLFAAVCDADQRADVVHATGATFDAAWELLERKLAAAMSASNRTGRWLRIDWVRGVGLSTWGMLRQRLVDTKRNYFRRGLALDFAFDRAFLEQEINGNAMLYGGNAIVHAVVNEKNIALYAEARFPGREALDFADAADVHVFTTDALFVDETGELVEIVPEGLNAGRRRIDALTDPQLQTLIKTSSRYLALQLGSDGRFVYGYHPCFDRTIDTYNALRHASTTLSMIEAWSDNRDPELHAAIDRSLHYIMTTLIREATLPDGTTAAFLVEEDGEIKLGGNACSILALSKYVGLTGETAYLPLLEKLALGIRFMQDQNDGSFTHILNPDLTVRHAFRVIYYEGEAAYALMRLYQLTHDERWLGVVEKAFEHFIAREHWRYHDHWLAYCVNELTRIRPEERYFRFAIDNVTGYLDFIENRITTFPTLLELMMAARETLTRLEGLPHFHHLFSAIDLVHFERALEARAHYLLNGFFWPEMAMFFRRPNAIVGSFFIRHHAFRVRIDDVQHYLSGYVAYRNYLNLRDDFRALVQRRTAAPPSWNAQLAADVTAGAWTVAPPPGWSASGLCAYAPAMKPGNMITVRAAKGGGGISPPALKALKDTASALITTEPELLPAGIDLPVLKVQDIDATVMAIGRYARSRLEGKLFAVTGSAGKTSTVAMMAHALEAWGDVSKTSSNANLPFGVAWNLAQMPWNQSDVVLELAVGRMAQSSQIARPDVAIFTNILPAHLVYHNTLEQVARLKSNIFRGMEPGGVAVLNRDMNQWAIVHDAARLRRLNIVHYGQTPDSDVRLLSFEPEQRLVEASIRGRIVTYRIGASGIHMALNSLAVLGAIEALGRPIEPAMERLASFTPVAGRGEEFSLAVGEGKVDIIDDAYNANPGSMQAAIINLAERKASRRRVAVFGEMRELGNDAETYHTELVDAIERLPIDRVHVMGDLYNDFWEKLSPDRRGRRADSIEEIKAFLGDEMQAGDTILFKGSHGTRIHEVVSWIKKSI